MSWVVTAYSVFWVAIFLYTLLMSRKQKELDRRIDELRERLEERREHDSPSP